MATKAVKVIGGPSQWDLIIKGLVEREPVTFTLVDGSKVAVEIRSVANETHWDTVTAEGEGAFRVGRWLNEGERVPTEAEFDTDIFYIVYLAYSAETRDGLYNVYEHDN